VINRLVTTSTKRKAAPQDGSPHFKLPNHPLIRSLNHGVEECDGNTVAKTAQRVGTLWLPKTQSELETRKSCLHADTLCRRN
jgi:hypothetical protein